MTQDKKYKVNLLFTVSRGGRKHYSIELQSTIPLTDDEWKRVRDAVIEAFERTHPKR